MTLIPGVSIWVTFQIAACIIDLILWLIVFVRDPEGLVWTWERPRYWDAMWHPRRWDGEEVEGHGGPGGPPGVPDG